MNTVEKFMVEKFTTKKVIFEMFMVEKFTAEKVILEY
jgi:hypothetical protein